MRRRPLDRRPAGLASLKQPLSENVGVLEVDRPDLALVGSRRLVEIGIRMEDARENPDSGSARRRRGTPLDRGGDVLFGVELAEMPGSDVVIVERVSCVRGAIVVLAAGHASL